LAEEFNIEEKAQKMGCKIKGPLSILPNNFKMLNLKNNYFMVLQKFQVAYLRKNVLNLQ
jgi:hypothetical protein